jgi:hypothetical protein
VLVDMLELDLEKYQMSDPKYYRDHYNPLVPYAKLLFGIISVVISAVWFIHIIIYMLFNPPVRAPGGAGWVGGWGVGSAHSRHTAAPLSATPPCAAAPLPEQLPDVVRPVVPAVRHPHRRRVWPLSPPRRGQGQRQVRHALLPDQGAPAGDGQDAAELVRIQHRPGAAVRPGQWARPWTWRGWGGYGGSQLATHPSCPQPATQFCTEAFSQYARLTDADLIFGNQFKYMQASATHRWGGVWCGSRHGRVRLPRVRRA